MDLRHRSRSVRIGLGTIAAVLVLGGCTAPDSEFLADGGPILDWVGQAEGDDGAATTTTTVPDRRAIAGLSWVNDDLALGGDDATPTEVTARVYAASTGTDRFVQTAASDIALVLPGIDVPSVVPNDVTHVSSQLVFDTAARRLDDDPAAAFGFWTVEPYSQSRSVGQRMVLLVAIDVASGEQQPDPAATCVRFESRGPCEPTAFGDEVGWWITEGGGQTLVWYDAPHRYELRVRGEGSRGLAEVAAASMVPIEVATSSSGETGTPG